MGLSPVGSFDIPNYHLKTPSPTNYARFANMAGCKSSLYEILCKRKKCLLEAGISCLGFSNLPSFEDLQCVHYLSKDMSEKYHSILKYSISPFLSKI